MVSVHKSTAIYTQESAALLPQECNILLGYNTFNGNFSLSKVERSIIVLFFNVK